jgi:electron transport complex protein RnfA
VNILAALGVFAALACNLVLHFGLGIRALATEKEGGKTGRAFYAARFLEGAVIFLSVLLLWIVFTYLLGPLGLGLFRFILIFPLSVPVCAGFETLLRRFIPREWGWSPVFRTVSAYEGLIPAALFLALQTVSNVPEAAVLAFSFVLGILFPTFILEEIRRRAGFEAVPRFLRGSPLALLSLGLMSLVFASIAALFFSALGSSPFSVYNLK